ncbi:MAG TPA: hypothetical protein VMY39_05540 [Planctomycetota bacterium]|nr:hypothetical protein [Planctomycetota bacterium]
MKRLSGVLLMGVLLSTVVFAADAKPWDTEAWTKLDAVGRFRWGVDLLQMGRPEDAAGVLQRVVDAAPDARDVARMHDLLDADTRGKMVADERTRKVVEAWVTVYEDALTKLRRDDAYLREMTGKLTGDGTQIELGMKRLKQMGEFGVPHVLKLLADATSVKDRVTCHRLLMELGRASVLPAIECLNSPDDSLRVTVLELLGELKDVRAQAVITQFAVDREATDVVRQTAMTALLRILHEPRPGIPLSRRATVNYYRLADAYLHEADFTLPTLEGAELPLWKWSTGKGWIVYTMVPRALYNEELAEEACYDGLELDKEDRSLRAMAIAVYFAQRLELIETGPAEVERQIEMAIMVGGKLALQDCLAKALRDDDRGIAIQASQALGRVGEGKGFSILEQLRNANPLLAALDHEDRAVRFAAARAIVRCQPKVSPFMVAFPGRPAEEAAAAGRFDNHDKVLPALCWGLMVELPSKTVLIISPDLGTVNDYKDELRKLGHWVADGKDVVEGMTWAASLPKPDVILLAEEYVAAANGLREMMGSRQVPIIMLAKSDAEGPEGVVQGTLRGKADPGALKLMLGRVLEVPEKSLVTKLIPKISERAAQAMSQVIPGASPLSLRSTAPALVRVLKSPDDDVRTPALVALGHIAAHETTLDVLAVAADTRAKKPVRLAALEALAAILEAQAQVPPDVFRDLVPVTSDVDPDISLAAARAVAVAKFEPAQFADLMVLKRVQEIKAGQP